MSTGEPELPQLRMHFYRQPPPSVKMAGDCMLFAKPVDHCNRLVRFFPDRASIGLVSGYRAPHCGPQSSPSRMQTRRLTATVADMENNVGTPV